MNNELFMKCIIQTIVGEQFYITGIQLQTCSPRMHTVPLLKYKSYCRKPLVFEMGPDPFLTKSEYLCTIEKIILWNPWYLACYSGFSHNPDTSEEMQIKLPLFISKLHTISLLFQRSHINKNPHDTSTVLQGSFASSARSYHLQVSIPHITCSGAMMIRPCFK